MKKLLIIIFQITITILLSKNVFAAEELPSIYIKAINPGYSVDGKSNVGEFVELARTDSDSKLSLAGLVLGYTNSSGNYTPLYEFPDESWMTGERILLRLASSPDSELADLVYYKTLAFKAGPLELSINGEIIDSVCWDGSEKCMKEFKSSSPTTLVRNDETMIFEHIAEYEPQKGGYFIEEKRDETLPQQCKGLEFSEILSYYETSQSEQFIEFYNSTSEQILLDGCFIKYKNKQYSLSGIIKPESYLARFLSDFALTKNPTDSNQIQIIDTDGSVVDTLVYSNGQRKGTSFIKIGYDYSGQEIWRTTYAPTPGEPNNYQEYKTCESGKVLNEATGNCVKATTVSEKVCGEGQYLNPLTGRCKTYTTTTTKTCAEGYELNPETNRCRKIQNNNGADYPVEEEEYEESKSFIAIYAVIGVVVLGVIYIIYEFRHEIIKFFGKVFRLTR